MKPTKIQRELLEEGSFLEIDFNIDLSRFKDENGEINYITLSDFFEDLNYNTENDDSYFKSVDDDIDFNYYSAQKVCSIEKEYKNFCIDMTFFLANVYAPSLRKKISIFSFLIYTILGSTIWSEVVFTDKNFTFSLVAGIVFGFYGCFMTFISGVGNPGNRSIGEYIRSCVVYPHIIAFTIYITVIFILWLFQPDGWLHWLFLIGFIVFVLFLCFIFLIEWDNRRGARRAAKQQEAEREADKRENKKRIPRIAKLVVERRIEGTEFEFDIDYIDRYTNEIIELIDTSMDITYDFTNEQYVDVIIKYLNKNDRKLVWEQTYSPEAMRIRAENIAELVVAQQVEGTEFEFNKDYIETHTRGIINLIDKHITISNDFSDQEYVEYIIKLIEKQERKMAWEEEE